MGMRFVAGLVDLAPILAVVAILHPANAGNPLASIDEKSLSSLAELSVATYVLHTLVAELICGQSIGKMVFGSARDGLGRESAEDVGGGHCGIC